MINQFEIENERRRRKREADDEFIRLLRDTSPEGKAKLEALIESDQKEKAQHQRELDAAVAMQEEGLRREQIADQQTADDILHSRVLQRLGDYRQLYFYQKSKVIYDLTFAFCDRFITEYHDRTKDQMVQAARSGKQNFVEGMQDGQADFEQAMHLVTVGQGSLQELIEDYEDYLRTRKLPQWTKEHPRYQNLVNFCKHNNEVTAYTPLFSKMNDEELANMAITLIHQTDYLIEGFLKKLEDKFIELGGTKERMRRIRSMSLGKTWRLRR